MCRDGFSCSRGGYRHRDANAKLVANDASNFDWFGISVAISDGIAVVGAREDDDNGSSSGSAYVFEMISSGNSSSWAQVAKLTADDGAANDRLGVSVAISDGIIVVGAPWDDNKKRFRIRL